MKNMVVNAKNPYKYREVTLDEAWLGLNRIPIIEKHNNPLMNLTPFEKDHPGMREITLMRNPKYLGFAAKILLGIDLLPIQVAVLDELWSRPFPMYIASRGFGKSFLTSVLCMLKAALVPGTKIVVVGAAFRQSKVLFEYMDKIWKNAPVLQSVCSRSSGPRTSPDRCEMRINDSSIICVPLGDGSKIRGLRAHIIIADEFASIPPDIYETVVAGFAAVSANPIENVRTLAAKKMAKELGLWAEGQEDIYKIKSRNQAIISGTADYAFKHYAQYWQRYCKIIRAQNDPYKMAEIFESADEEIDISTINSDDYTVIRIPYELIPKGFMDDAHVMRAKATVHSGIYQMEYGAVFTADSKGFFKRSLIEGCVATKSNLENANWPEYCDRPFDAIIRGSKGKKYIFGIDPAIGSQNGESDNFSIVVLEVHPEHQRVVYVWTTNRKDFKKKLKQGEVNEDDYYGFCARKIRDLIKLFPLHQEINKPSIGMDAQGGGIAVLEALSDKGKMLEGEEPILEYIDSDNEKDSDDMPGLHLIELVQFADYKWTREANHGLRKDMEDKVILFPQFDGVSLGLAVGTDNASALVYDSLENTVMEIEELKDELSTIVMTQTGTGVNARDRWDTPEVKMEGGKKGRLRKDRYSALVIANMIARQISRSAPPTEYRVIGGNLHAIKDRKSGSSNMYEGPEWFTKGANNKNVFRVIKK